MQNAGSLTVTLVVGEVSVGSRRRKVHDPVDVPNAVKLDIQGGHAVILALISIQMTKAMLLQWRIYWMVHGYQEVGRRSVQVRCDCPVHFSNLLVLSALKS